MKAWVLIFILMSGEGGSIPFDTELGCIVGKDLHEIRARFEGDPVRESVCVLREGGTEV